MESRQVNNQGETFNLHTYINKYHREKELQFA